ncbi:MAG: hypothetical protein ACTS3F_02495 [Phycisphaerales bacterium]
MTNHQQPIQTDPQPRRGVALLVVLVLLLAIATVGPVLLTRSWNTGSHAMLGHQRAAAACIADDIAAVVAARLGSTQANSDESTPALTLDPGSDFTIRPGWQLVLDQSLDPSTESEASSGMQGARVRVWLVDLSGRLHVRYHRAIVAEALPPAIAQALDPIAIDRALDRRAASRQNDAAIPLPPPMLTSLVRTGGHALHPDDPASEARCAEALTHWVTTGGDGALNIATAPIDLLETALLGLDSQHGRAVIDARRRDLPLPPDSARALIQARERQIADDEATRLVPLTDRSTAIGLLIDVTFASHTVRSWHIVTPRPDAAQIQRRGQGSPRRARTIEATIAEPSAWRVASSQSLPPPSSAGEPASP